MIEDFNGERTTTRLYRFKLNPLSKNSYTEALSALLEEIEQHIKSPATLHEDRKSITLQLDDAGLEAANGSTHTTGVAELVTEAKASTAMSVESPAPANN